MRKRADGRYAVKITTSDGPCFVYGRTVREARTKAEDVRARVAAGAPVRDATRSLEDWLREWQETSLEISGRAESTKVMYRGHCQRWIVPCLGAVPLGQLKPQDVTRLLVTMQKEGRSASTQRNVYTVLRKALDDAVVNGLLAANPAHKLRQPRVRREEARFPTPEDAAALLAAIEGLRYAHVLRLILGTGLRRGEALALRWEDVDLDRAEATVRGALVRQRGSLRVVATKTHRSRRTIALSVAMVALLEAQKARQAEERFKAGNLWCDAGFVFTTELGNAVEPQNLLRSVRTAATRCGLSDINVHTLRHTYATTALMTGVPLKVVSVNMGHASIQITADTYGHVTDEAARSGAEAVSAALGL